MLRLGVIGYGYWGPNLVRNFSSIQGATVTSVCDIDERRLQSIQAVYICHDYP